MDRTYTRYRGSRFTMKEVAFLRAIESSLAAWEVLLETIDRLPLEDLKELAAQQRPTVAAMRKKFREDLAVTTLW
jgi:hypothetical protein